MEPYSESDVVVINGNDEDLESMKTNMIIRQANQKSKKKNKPSKVENSEEIKNVVVDDLSKMNEQPGPSSSKQDEIPLDIPKRIPIEVNQLKTNKRSCTAKIEDPVYKKAKDDYSVAKDPKATDVFKSLFTSHQSDKTQQRAHWITYNPFYN
jgi:hypothetical protein